MANFLVPTGAGGGPLPSDPHGQRLWSVFGRYPWAWLEGTPPSEASSPGSGPSPAVQWRTVTAYPLRPRLLWTRWQDAAQLVGVRFGQHTTYGLLDLDAGGGYTHPEAVARIAAALETLGLTRTVLVQSSWRGGLHLYIPLPEPVSSFNLACAIAQCLHAHGLPLQPGQIEAFPNVKTYGVSRFVEYNGHRLPLQPGSGSQLLNGDLAPIGTDLASFWQAWDQAAQGQDGPLLSQALARARQTRRQRQRPPSLGQLQQWQQDLEGDIAEGWTGPGQTNGLLKAIACQGLVFHHHQGSDLVAYIQHTAQHCPGYHQHCRHRHHLRQRAIAWATAVEHYYWPAGTRPRRESPPAPNGNTVRACDARDRIQAAVAALMQTQRWPTTVRDRVAALTRAAQTSARTLYKHLALWHPRHFSDSSVPAVPAYAESTQPAAVPPSRFPTAPAGPTHPATPQQVNAKKPVTPQTARDTGDDRAIAASSTIPAIPLESRLLPTQRESMKCSYPVEVPVPPSFDQKTLVRGVRGEKSHFPQARPEYPSEELPLGEILTSIQQTIGKLDWDFATVQQFIRDRFQGKQRRDLADSDLVTLLYHLQVALTETTTPPCPSG
jgi:hypothetical protein